LNGTQLLRDLLAAVEQVLIGKQRRKADDAEAGGGTLQEVATG